MPDVPHFRFPMDVVGGRMVTVEQETVEELRSNVNVLLAVRPGDRLLLPEFGTPDLTFMDSREMDDAIIRAAQRWEARAQVNTELNVDSYGSVVDIIVNVNKAEA